MNLAVRLLWCFGGLCRAWILAQSPPVFAARRLPFVHRHSPTAQKYLLETMGGGGTERDLFPCCPTVPG